MLPPVSGRSLRLFFPLALQFALPLPAHTQDIPRMDQRNLRMNRYTQNESTEILQAVFDAPAGMAWRVERTNDPARWVPFASGIGGSFDLPTIPANATSLRSLLYKAQELGLFLLPAGQGLPLQGAGNGTLRCRPRSRPPAITRIITSFESLTASPSLAGHGQPYSAPRSHHDLWPAALPAKIRQPVLLKAGMT